MKSVSLVIIELKKVYINFYYIYYNYKKSY